MTKNNIRRQITLSMTEMVIAIIAMTMFLTLIGFGISLAGASSPSQPTPRFMTRQCAEEDSVGCWWDGGDHSFWAIRVGNLNCAKYWNRAYDRTHANCIPISNPRWVHRRQVDSHTDCWGVILARKTWLHCGDGYSVTR